MRTLPDLPRPSETAGPVAWREGSSPRFAPPRTLLCELIDRRDPGITAA